MSLEPSTLENKPKRRKAVGEASAPETPALEVAIAHALHPELDQPTDAPSPIEAAAWSPPVEQIVHTHAPEEPVMLENSTADATATIQPTAAAAATFTAQPGFEAYTVKAKEMMETSMKSMTDMTEFAKGNVEAMVASAKAATAGAETIMTTVVEHSKKQFEGGSTAVKSMTAVKTPAELIQLQNDYVKGQFDATVAMWSNLSETMLKVAGEVAQPLSSRMALAGEQVKASFAR